jgi:hypothetical protein
MILKPRRRDKKLECRGRKDHEGKTSGSILHGLVYAHKCALLVNFRIHDAKKNPGGRTGTLRTTGILSLSVLNAAKDWVTPGAKFKSMGLSLK